MRSVDSETLLSAVFSPRLSGKISARDISGNRAISFRTGCHAWPRAVVVFVSNSSSAPFRMCARLATQRLAIRSVLFHI